MKLQNIVDRLRGNLPSDVKLRPSSKNSKSSFMIIPENGELPHETLRRIFKVEVSDWKEKFDEATQGPGEEWKRILTLHSSALLALLCFSHVSQENPLEIDGIKYTKRWFEVRNRVFRGPSCIDVVLRSNDDDVLFIESKFTELLDKRSPDIKMAYFDTYKRLLPLIPDRPLQSVYPHIFKEQGKEIVGFTIQPTSKDEEFSHLYLCGIKQCISHIIGLVNGPVDPEEACWVGIDTRKIRFATICYGIEECEEFTTYQKFYAQTIGQFNTPDIRKLFQNRVTVIAKILTYQEIFKKDSFKLPNEIRDFYGL